MDGDRPRSDIDSATACLKALGIPFDGVRIIESLAGGGSGTAVWRIGRNGNDPDGARDTDLILKLARPHSPSSVWERAGREVSFYRYLAPAVHTPVPTMVAGGEVTGYGIALVLEPLRPVLLADPLPWSVADYLAVAAALGRFHATWWGRSSELDALPWLQRDRPLASADRRHALELWQRLAREPALAGLLPPSRLGTLDDYLLRLAEGRPSPPPFPRTLCHGDFHAGNVLHDASGRCVIADWQEVRVGHAPDDLAFFGLRATSGGSPVPVVAMFAAWGAEVEAGTGSAVDLEAARRVADIAELRSRILRWPAYLSGGDPE